MHGNGALTSSIISSLAFDHIINVAEQLLEAVRCICTSNCFDWRNSSSDEILGAIHHAMIFLAHCLLSVHLEPTPGNQGEHNYLCLKLLIALIRYWYARLTSLVFWHINDDRAPRSMIVIRLNFGIRCIARM